MPPPFDTATASPAGAGVSAPGQPPFGPSPLSAPTASRGNEAAAAAKVAGAIDILKEAVAQVDLTSDAGQAVVKALELLGKHFPGGTSTPGAQHAAMQQFMMQQRQANPLIQALMAARQGGGAPGGAAMPPGAAGSPGGMPTAGV